VDSLAQPASRVRDVWFRVRDQGGPSLAATHAQLGAVDFGTDRTAATEIAPRLT
jgi:hypothetical protein